MGDKTRVDEINSFLGSVHVFLSTLNSAFETKLQAKAADRLTISQWKLLKLVSLGEGHNLGDVAAFLGISNAAASKAVDKLVRRMLLRRSEGNDRRAINLSLTQPGHRLLKSYEATREEKLQELFGQLPLEQLREVGDVLDRLSAGIIEKTGNAQEICLQCGIYFHEKCLVSSLLSQRCLYQKHTGRCGDDFPAAHTFSI